MSANHFDRSIDGVSLTDRSQVDMDSRSIEADRLRLRVEPKMMPAGPSPGIGQRFRIRHALRSSNKTPGFRQSPRGNVVSSVRLPAELDGPFEQVEQSRFDRDRL